MARGKTSETGRTKQALPGKMDGTISEQGWKCLDGNIFTDHWWCCSTKGDALSSSRLGVYMADASDRYWFFHGRQAWLSRSRLVYHDARGWGFFDQRVLSRSFNKAIPLAGSTHSRRFVHNFQAAPSSLLERIYRPKSGRSNC